MSLANVAKRSKTVIVGYKIYQNWRNRQKLDSGNIETEYGSTHSQKSTSDSVKYIQEQFADYLEYSNLQPADLSRKKILELGSGDNIGVALKFLAAGAAKVVCVDRFYSRRDQKQQRDIYKALRETLSTPERERFDPVISLTDGFEIDDNRLKCLYGKALEDIDDELLTGDGPFDLIVSRAVIEEIYDPWPAFQAMDQLLKPGGLLVHKIDLSDYGIFSEHAQHPLTFLTIGESVYRMMASHSALPNRKRREYYRRMMEQLGYHAQLFVTSVIERGAIVPHKLTVEGGVDYNESILERVNEIKPRLCEEFAHSTDQDLIVNGIFLVARKPADSIS